MNILMVATRMGIGGAETHILTLACELARRSHRVHVLSAGGAYVDSLEESGVTHTVLPLDKKDPLSLCICRRAIKRIVRGSDFDVVHAHGRIAALVCQSLSKKAWFPPFAVTAHGFYDPAPPRRSLTCWGARTVAVSEDVKKFLIDEYRLPEDRIEVITNGVELDPPLHRKGKGVRIITASRLDSDSAQTQLLLCRLMPRLCRDFPHLSPSLTVVGGGEKFSELREVARWANSEVPGCVRVLGGVTDINEILADGDIFVGSSRAALEAMAAALPVVLASNFGCEGVLDEKNLKHAEETNFTCRGAATLEIDLLRTSLSRLLCASERARTTLGMFGRAYIEKRASSEMFVDKTLAFWRRLIDIERPEIMLCGYFGAQNAGDDATLDAVLSQLELIGRRENVSVITHSKKHIPAEVRAIGRFNNKDIKKTLKKTRLFILCGGSLLQNSTSDRSLLYYHRLVRTAKRYGARVMVWGGGIGPLIGDRAVKTTLHTLALADSVTVRDPDSIRFLKYLGADTTDYRLTADAAVATLPAELPADLDLSDGEKYFAVCPRSLRGLRRGAHAMPDGDVLSVLADSVRDIAREFSFTPLWISLSPEDEKIAARLCRRAGVGRVIPRLSHRETVSLISRCNFVIGMRLHASVFASVAGVPSIAISYDPKVAAFAKYASHPKPLDLERDEYSPAAVLRAVSSLYACEEQTRRNVRDRCAELAELAAGDVRSAEALIYGYITEAPQGENND